MATRLYIDSATAAAVSPTYGGWGNTANATRKRLNITKASSAMSTITGPTNKLAESVLLVQAVSVPLAAQTISGTVKVQARASESSAITAVDRILLTVVSNDGSTVTGTLLTLGGYGPGTQFAVSTLTNRKFADGDTLTSVVANAGDRIVLEIGYNRGTSVFDQSASISIGDNSASDLAEDESTTTANNPWIEFSMNIDWNVVTATGGVTPTGAIVQQPKKLLAGAITPAGALVQQVRQLLSGSLTPAGALINQARQILAGAVTPTGSVSSTIVVAVKVFIDGLRAVTIYSRGLRTTSVNFTAQRIVNTYYLASRITSVYKTGKRAISIAVNAFREKIGRWWNL